MARQATAIIEAMHAERANRLIFISMYAAHDLRIETVPDARLVEPTDALVRVTRARICGSDLWPYNSMPRSETGNRMGHEFIGLVEAVGPDVRTVKKGK